MKNLLTLFLVTLTALSFAQQGLVGPHRQFHVMPNSPQLSDYRHGHSASVGRSSGACDTSDVLDYNAVDEYNSAILNISYEGSWYVPQAQLQPWAQEITTSFVNLTSYRNQLFSYAMMAYDTLAFANVPNASYYSKTRKASTITLDSVQVIMGIAGDTTTGGKMANDSLVFKIYSTAANGLISAAPVKTVSFVGLSALAPFITGVTAGYLRVCAPFPVGYTFTQGQGFAVRLEYYNSDTSSHCFVAYSFPDSCGNVTISGQTGIAPAYPAAFNRTAFYATGGQNLPGSAFSGIIDSLSPTAATIFNITNDFAYPPSAFAIPLPSNCLFVYNQNWEMLSYVTVNSTLGISLATPTYTIPCTNSANPYPLTTTRTGDLGGAVYTWSTNVYGSQSAANSTFFNPGTYSVTVTNSSGCTATASEVAAFASGANQTPSFTVPATICQGLPFAYMNTSSDTTGYSSHWNFGQGGTSTSTATNPVYTYSTSGTFTISLIMDSAGCEFATNQSVTVNSQSVCVGIQEIGFDNNVSIIPNPSNGNVNITISDADKNVTLTIYNIIGETVKSYATTESTSIFNKNLDLSNLANGTYLVKIQSGNKSATKKLFIAK